jgi:hypothetical protein
MNKWMILELILDSALEVFVLIMLGKHIANANTAGIISAITAAVGWFILIILDIIKIYRSR